MRAHPISLDSVCLRVISTNGGLKMGGSILGNRVLRKEDPKFLTTGGVYVDDLLSEPALVGALHVT